MNENQDWKKIRESRRKGTERRKLERLRRNQLLSRIVAFALCALTTGLLATLASGKAMERGGVSGGSGVSRLADTPRIAVISSQPAADPSPTPAPHPVSDPLLVLVNSDTPLPEDWVPELTPVAEGSAEQVDVRIHPQLTAMTEAARHAGVWFWVTSGYRSPELQQELLTRKIRENVSAGMEESQAEADARRTIQAPGCSEHHTGLAVDFNTASDEFETTDAYAWLCEHSAEYGFVQRYKLSKAAWTGIDNESWHFRYVGTEHAREMERLDMCLEEYTAYLADK